MTPPPLYLYGPPVVSLPFPIFSYLYIFLSFFFFLLMQNLPHYHFPSSHLSVLIPSWPLPSPVSHTCTVPFFHYILIHFFLLFRTFPFPFLLSHLPLFSPSWPHLSPAWLTCIIPTFPFIFDSVYFYLFFSLIQNFQFFRFHL